MVFMWKKKRRPFNCEILKESVVNAGKLRLLKASSSAARRELCFNVRHRGQFIIPDVTVNTIQRTQIWETHSTQYCTSGTVKSTTGLVQLFAQMFPIRGLTANRVIEDCV